jgi:hypothetical protein
MGVASIRDSAGSYGPGFGVLVVLALLGAIAVALLPRAAAARNEQEPAAA